MHDLDDAEPATPAELPGELRELYRAWNGLRLFADTIVPNTTFGARIDSDQQIIVERSLYVADGAGGHNSSAIQIPTGARPWI